MGKLISGDYQLGLTLYLRYTGAIVAACLSYMGAFCFAKGACSGGTAGYIVFGAQSVRPILCFLTAKTFI